MTAARPFSLPMNPRIRRKHVAPRIAVLVAGLCIAFTGYALDLVTFSGITGPMTSALTQLSALGPGIKALVGFVGFIVALISLSALRNFGPVLFYIGLAIFGAVGLVIAGEFMGAVICGSGEQQPHHARGNLHPPTARRPVEGRILGRRRRGSGPLLLFRGLHVGLEDVFRRVYGGRHLPLPLAFTRQGGQAPGVRRALDLLVSAAQSADLDAGNATVSPAPDGWLSDRESPWISQSSAAI